MRLPRLQHPERYAGLYVVDFGDATAVGYTGEEVAMLRESERFAAAKVYRIYRAGPDGTLELQAVAGEKFYMEAGVFFYSRELAQARADFDALRLLADAVGMPCRTQLLLAGLGEPAPLPFVVGLAYSAECDMDISTWLLDNGVHIGQHADGGVARLADIRQQADIIETAQLQVALARRARSRQEVLDSVDRPIQRVL